VRCSPAAKPITFVDAVSGKLRPIPDAVSSLFGLDEGDDPVELSETIRAAE
jgi:hypothetical protein